ncbi:unnamed protein product [Adineta ricciae]|uniref:Uncharacterized protein n=1 Tax=Adineta ricciae TaxID=249248 RepID=A0A815EQ33_ADIRI|nr:unnamed protein product [Adineta ricciae]CAF1375236.1 unnamed protein product [Adineta ricciae]
MSKKSNNLPYDVIELENEPFYQFVKKFAGDKVVSLLQFQDIDNVECLMACSDPFEILSYDSDDLLDLKKKTCLKLKTNSHVVLPGIKSKMKLLKKALTRKYDEIKNVTTTFSNQSMSMDTSFTNSTVDNALPNTTSSTLEENVKIHLINSMKEWCRKTKQDNAQRTLDMVEGTDYEIVVDCTSNKVYIKCQCGKTSTLGQKNNLFILSNYIRHLTSENPCSMVRDKLENSRDTLTVGAVDTFDNDDSSLSPGLPADGSPSSSSSISKLSKRKRSAKSSSTTKKTKTV